MAKKKKSTQTSTSSATSRAPKPQGPSYEEILEARRAMDAAHANVVTVNNRLRSARTDMSDFKVRDRKVAEAEEALREARLEAAEASNRFNQLKFGR